MKLLKRLFSRYTISILVIIAEITGIIVFSRFLAGYIPLLWTAILVTSFIAYLVIVNADENPEFKVPWISIVLLFPPYGALLFAMFHRRRMKRKEIKHLERLSGVVEKEKRNLMDLEELKKENRVAYGNARSLMRDDPYAEVYQNTQADYFTTGQDMWKQMLIDMERAQNFIFLEYFIIERGKMWDSMLEILTAKVKAGVEVRVMFDDIGCMAVLPENYDTYLRSLGIKCYRFSKLMPEATPAHNNRDHRKILVVDGKVGYTGGINLADEYINHIQKYGFWKDGGIRLTGEAVRNLIKLFLINWDVTEKEISEYERYLSCTTLASSPEAEGFFIPFGSGPGPAYKSPVGKNVFLNTINQAQYYLYITTPYLIIDYDLTTALQNAAVRGVDVRIITPHIPDKKMVQLLTRNSYATLIAHGVRIFEYEPGFIHQKTVLSDDQYAIVGTINFDYRSLVHHYENAVWIYGAEVLRDIWQDFDETLGQSIEIKNDTIKMNIVQKLIRDCIRLFAPLF